MKRSDAKMHALARELADHRELLPILREPGRGRLRTEDDPQTTGGAKMKSGKAHQLFGEQLPTLLDELNEVLAA